MTIANLDSDDLGHGFAPVALLIVFSAIGYFTIFNYMKEVRRFSQRLAQ
jgi:hypothetical protein